MAVSTKYLLSEVDHDACSRVVETAFSPSQVCPSLPSGMTIPYQAEKPYNAEWTTFYQTNNLNGLIVIILP